MDDDVFDKGLAKRKSTLGAEYVERNFAAADDFTFPIQEAISAIGARRLRHHAGPFGVRRSPFDHATSGMCLSDTGSMNSSLVPK